MKLPELLERTGITARQVRYLISHQLVPAPTGGRAHAFYGDEHVEAIRRYTRLRRLGFSPASIRVLLQAKQGVPFPVAEGVTLVVPPELVGSGRPVGPLLAAIESRLREIVDQDDNEVDREPEAHQR